MCVVFASVVYIESMNAAVHGERASEHAIIRRAAISL